VDWWRRLPALVRIPVAVAVILLATLVFVRPPGVDGRGNGAAVGLLFALGIILLFTGPTDAQKKGYHDF